MSRLIVSNIETQNIKFDSDTTAFSINSSGVLNTSSIVIKGEGTATTNLQQGLCKVWADYPGAATSITDSFNVASITDTTTGVSTINFTNSMRAIAYSCTNGNQLAASGGTGIFYANVFGRAASSCGASHFENGSNVDPTVYSAQITGDLA